MPKMNHRSAESRVWGICKAGGLVYAWAMAEGAEANGRVNYLAAYRPLLQMLDSDEDLDVLAAEDGYSRDIGRSYRDLRRRVMRGYLLDLEADFERLYEEARSSALGDAKLARLLSDMEDNLCRVRRQVHFRLWLEAVLPLPDVAGRVGLLLRLLRKAMPKAKQSSGLLTSMTALRRSMAAPVGVS